MMRKLAAMMLCIAMVLALLPMSVFAEEDQKVHITITIKVLQLEVDYDGQLHTIKVNKDTIQASCDNPEFEAGFIRMSYEQTVKGTEPGVYEQELDLENFDYVDSAVEATFKAEGDLYLKIKEPTGGPVIKKQPEDVHCAWPKGGSFSVEVEDPGSVASYQWLMFDGANWHTLDGISAKTSEIVIPSTRQDYATMTFRCRITGKDGKITYSDGKDMFVEDEGTDKTVLYVGNYAIEPGQTLDLSKTELGSGKISFEDDGSDIIVNNVKYSNENMIYDLTLTPAFGISLFRYDNQTPEYNFILVGKNEINNVFYQEAYNTGAEDFEVYLPGKNIVRPDVNLKGKGSLLLKGGSKAISVFGKVSVGCPVTTIPRDLPNGHKLFLDGIHADSITVREGVKLDLNVNGGGLVAECDTEPPKVTLEPGSEVEINTCAPHISAAYTSKWAVFTTDLLVDQAKLTINGDADPNEFHPYDLQIAAFGGIFINAYGSLEAKDSTIDINLTAQDSDKDYIMAYLGVNGDEKGNISLSGTDLSIDIQSKMIPRAFGLYTSGALNIENGSKVTTNLAVRDNVYGIAPEGDLVVKDSSIKNVCKTEDESDCYGIMCNSANIEYTKKGYSIISDAKDGIAFAANPSEGGDTLKSFDDKYQASKIVCKNANVVTPAKSAISISSIPGNLEYYIYIETIYDLNDISKPASHIEILPDYSDSNVPDKDRMEISDIQLASTAKTYTGKAIIPNLIVKAGDKVLQEGTDYTVAVTNNIGVGTAVVTVRGIGNYKGMKYANFKIQPKKTSISKVTAGKKKITVKWKKQTAKMPKNRITGYQIQYGTKKKFTSGTKKVKVKGYKKTSKVVKKLKSKKTYYVRIRTYMKVSNKTYYSAWSKAKKVKVK